VFVGFNKCGKGCKIWDQKDKKFILSRDVTSDEASIVKPTNSQQVESEKTKGISQQVKSDATSSSLDRIVSLEIISTVTHGSDHVADQDADNDEDQEEVMDDIQESIIVEKAHRNPHKPSWLTTNMIEAILSQSLKRRSCLHIEKLKLVRRPRCGRMP